MNHGDLNYIAKYKGQDVQWMKKGWSLREYTGYLVAGTVVTGAIFLFDQQVYQRIHIKSKLSGF